MVLSFYTSVVAQPAVKVITIAARLQIPDLSRRIWCSHCRS